MTENYEPKSDFLSALANGQCPLSGNEFADANLSLLIELTSDEDRSNRDWATFLLASQDLDSPAIRDALLCAMEDPDEMVGAEAILGLARRDKNMALPLVQVALSQNSVCFPILEAAAMCAHPSLVDPLRSWALITDDKLFERGVRQALAACETGVPREI